jgi:integrase/recombinase XerD
MTDQVISPLRRRMIEGMTIRKLAPKTQHDYVQRVKDFAAFLGRSPEQAQPEDVRGFRLHLASIGAHAPKINATVSEWLAIQAARLCERRAWSTPEPSCRRSEHYIF